jgi:hypothetical protein
MEWATSGPSSGLQVGHKWATHLASPYGHGKEDPKSHDYIRHKSQCLIIELCLTNEWEESHQPLHPFDSAS